MLMIAQGTIHHPIDDRLHRATAAWLGPMSDAGVLHDGWIDATGGHAWLVLSASDLAEIRERLDHLPLVADGSVSFTLTPVSAIRLA